jgi:exosome complex RNA-binding protein Rrp4
MLLLPAQDSHEPGNGTYAHKGWIYASTMGMVQEQPAPADTVRATCRGALLCKQALPSRTP